MNKFPYLTYVYNKDYEITNCSGSLLLGLNKVENEDVIFMDGDIYFDYKVLPLLFHYPDSTTLVKYRDNCGDEETKFNLHLKSFVKNLSKKIVHDCVGESIGILKINKEDLPLLKKELEKIGPNKFYAEAINNLTSNKRLWLRAMDIGDYFCEEIDFPSDLQKVRDYLQ
jgi:choline kinase